MNDQKGLAIYSRWPLSAFFIISNEAAAAAAGADADAENLPTT